METMSATPDTSMRMDLSNLPWWLKKPSAVLLIVLAALASHSWMLDLEFQMDDWEQISDAINPSKDAVLLGKDSRNVDGEEAPATFVAFYRPLLFAAMWLDVQIFGADPWGHHLSSLLYHLFCVVLFYLTLLRVLPLMMTATPTKQIAFLAFTSALVFAAHPGCWGAVSWVAARGDVIATIFFLGAARALVAHRASPHPRKMAALFVCLFLALMAKEGAIICGPVLAVFDFFVLRKRGTDLKNWNTFWLALPLIAAVPAYMYFRVWKFGPYANLYAGHVRVINIEILKRTFHDFFRCFPHMTGGYFYCAEIKYLEILQRASAGFMFVMASLWILRKPVKRSMGFLFLLALYTIAVAPAMRFYREASGFDASRLFYLPFVFVSVIIAIPMQLFMARLKTIRLAAWVWLIFSFVTWGIGIYYASTTQVRASKITARVRQDVRAFAQSSGENPPAFVIFRLPVEVGNIPLYGTFLPIAFSKDFMDDPLMVFSTTSDDIKWELRQGGLHAHDYDVQVLEWKSDERDIGHLTPYTKILPGPIGYRPKLDWPDAGNKMELEQKLHPRDVKTLRINFKEAPIAPFEFKLVFSDISSDQELTIKWNPKKYGAADHVFMHFLEAPEWLFLGKIKTIELVPVAGEVPKLSSLDFGQELPKILSTLPDNTVFRASGTEPVLTFKEIEPCPWYRCRLFFGMKERTWTLPRQMLIHDNGELRFQLSRQGYFPQEFAMGWDALRQYLNSILDLQGLTEFKIRYKLEGLRGQIDPGSQPQAVSQEASFTFTK
ncbi:MAG: hypothetical protein ACI97A_001754 [Planctomycetota bacterium]|jgi:hypothetical protein